MNSTPATPDPTVPPEASAREQLRLWAPDPPALEALLERFRALVATILEAAGRMNLTGDREEALFWPRHIEDALAAAAQIAAAGGAPPPGARVLDVGSGGGIPGLVWALLWPHARVDLMEARQKRSAFLRQAASALALGNVGVLEGRAEDLAHQASLREAYALVTARALAPLPTLLELTLPLVRPQGWLGAIKTAPLDAELAQSRTALKLLGGGGVDLRPYTRSDGKNCVVCLVRKSRPTPARYPRRPNLPERCPLV